MAIAAVVLSLLLYITSITPARSAVVLEDGYVVTTVVDGNKLQNPIRPYSLVPVENVKGKKLVFLLDSVNSAFYGIPFPVSQDGEIMLLSGKGVAGYSDGDSTTATFSHPKSFAVDSAGNVYVADRSNHVIRKITPSGMTTTIAGGYSRKTGNIDGPAQNASFSDDYELVFIPGMCSLLITDRGNNLVRELRLNQQDCSPKSHSGLGTFSVSIIAILCAIVGCVAGFLTRTYLISHETHRFSKTWKHCQTKLGLILPILFSGIKNGAAKIAAIYMLTYKYVGCVFYHFPYAHNDSRQGKHVCRKDVVSLLDSDAAGNQNDMILNNYAEELRNLMSSTGEFDTRQFSVAAEELRNLVSSAGEFDTRQFSVADDVDDNVSKLDGMIASNIFEFAVQAREQQEQGEVEMPKSSNSIFLRRKRPKFQPSESAVY